MKNKSLDSLIDLIENKLDNLDGDQEDQLLSRSVLEFILELAQEKRKKQTPENIVANDEDLHTLTEHKISYEQ